MLQFMYRPEAEKATSDLSQRLEQELSQDKQVIWLVCGGSNIPLCVRVMRELPREVTGNLTIALTDERYGVPGHPDSNWKQLYDAGFDAGQATVIETLQPEHTLEDTCAEYERRLREALHNADVVIAQFGVGGDGHIAGILPQSPALTEDALVTGYDAGAYTRITITPPFWKEIDAAYAFVYGDTKRGALERLKDQDLSVSDQPAQLLKTVPEAYIYTDQNLDHDSEKENI